MKKILATVLILLLGLTMITGCTQSEVIDQEQVGDQEQEDQTEDQNQETEPVTMDFTVGECDQEIDPYEQSNLGVKETKWENGELHVKAIVSINCALEVIDAGYYLEGDALTLTYTTTSSDVLAMCYCAHEIDYVFSNLPEKEYVVELEKI